MKKIIIALIIIVVIILGITIAMRVSGPEDGWTCVNEVWVKHGNPVGEAPTSGCGPAEKTERFQASGNLIKNNPGLKKDVWYLSYEKAGSPGLLAELSFSDDIGTTTIKQGQKATIIGAMQNGIVQVQSIQFLKDENGLTVKLYYYNEKLDQGPGGALCSKNGLVAVERVIPRTQTPIQDSIKLLLRGEISPSEASTGISSEFPLSGLSLTSTNLKNGILTLEFNDSQNKTSGGSCRVGILWHQIEATAKQFSGVNEVKFIPDSLFQP